MKESIERLEDNDYMIRSLREEKEHTEKQMEDLFSYLAGEDQYTDQLKFFGDKYKQRIEEFQNLKIENEELKRHIADIKVSQDLKNLQIFEGEESNRVSMDRGKGESWSKIGTTNQTVTDQFRGRLQEISKLKNQASDKAKKENEQYDQLVAQLYKFFEKISTVRRLESVIKPGEEKDGQQATVTVPRRLYVRLVEVYSINMANICAKEFEQQIKNKQKDVPNQSNPVEQPEEKINAFYKDVVKEPDFEVSYFFKKLAEKFGFAHLWEKYHTENSNQAINFKGKIDKILRQDTIQTMVDRNQDKEETTLQDAIFNQAFRNKISQLVNELDFSQKQKDQWTTINDKMRRDKLFDMGRLSAIISKKYNQSNNGLIDSIEKLVSSVLKDFFEKLDKLLTQKLKNTKPIFDKVRLQLEEDILKEKLSQWSTQLAAQEIWQKAQTSTKQKLESVFGMLTQHFVYVGSDRIYSSRIKRQ